MEQARRGVLGGLIGAAALLSSPRDASAAFGDAARVRNNSKMFQDQCCHCDPSVEPEAEGVM